MERVTLEQALEILLGKVDLIEEKEEVILWSVLGRILAEDIVAKKDQPPFPRSPLDGYAVRSMDIVNASKETPVVLEVIDEVMAGYMSKKEVVKGTAIRIMTGAPIPDGADCVIMQEDTNYGETMVEIYKPLKAFQNYCFQGEDYKVGDKLISKGARLGAIEIGVLASLGCQRVHIYRKPKIALLTTGDEIVLPGEELKEGKIYDSNLYTLGSRLVELGIEVPIEERIDDDKQLVADKIEEVIDSVDMVITTGGVSVGKKDIMHDVFELLGCERLFWKIAMKPGMPTLCGLYKGKLIVCLSGNPFGASVNLEVLVRPLLEKMTKRKELKVQRKQAIMEDSFLKKSPVTRYVRAYYEDGHVRLPKGSNDSGVLSSLIGCNCIIEILAGTEKVEKGECVSVVMI